MLLKDPWRRLAETALETRCQRGYDTECTESDAHVAGQDHDGSESERFSELLDVGLN